MSTERVYFLRTAANGAVMCAMAGYDPASGVYQAPAVGGDDEALTQWPDERATLAGARVALRPLTAWGRWHTAAHVVDDAPGA
jgi:hypothetical protein